MSRRGSKAETHVLGAGWAARECRTARRVGLWCLGRSWDLGWRAGGSKNSSKHAPITRGGRVWLEIRSIDDVLVARCLACRRAGREWARRDGDGGGSPGKCALGAPCQNYAVAVLAQTRPQTIPTARLVPAPASLAWPPLRSRGQRRGMPSGQLPAASGQRLPLRRTSHAARREAEPDAGLSRESAALAPRVPIARGGSIASLPQQHPDGPRAQKHIEICARCLPCPSFSPLACRARCEYNKLCGPPLGLIPAHSAHILLSSPHTRRPTRHRFTLSPLRSEACAATAAALCLAAARDPRPATACCHSYFGRPAGRSLCILP